MKKLFIYYSLTGNIEEVASFLKDRGYSLRRVYEKKKMPKTFFWMIMTGGFRAGFNLKGKLIDYNNNIDGFDEIVIGSPLWNGKFPPAINSVLYQTDLKDKKVTFVISSGGGEAPKLEKKINKEYPNSKLIVLREIKKNKEQFDKLKEL